MDVDDEDIAPEDKFLNRPKFVYTRKVFDPKKEFEIYQKEQRS